MYNLTPLNVLKLAKSAQKWPLTNNPTQPMALKGQEGKTKEQIQKERETGSAGSNDKAANDTAAEFIRAKIREIVKDKPGPKGSPSWSRRSISA